MPYRASLALSATLLLWCACDEVRTTRTTSDNLEAVDSWTPAGAVTYLSPSALVEYAARGPELLTALYDGPISVNVDPNGPAIRLVATELDVTHSDDGAALLLTSVFSANGAEIDLDGCAVGWMPGEVTLSATVALSVDGAGTVVSTVDGWNVDVKTSSIVASSDCEPSVASSDSLKEAYATGVTEALSDDVPMATLARALIGANDAAQFQLGERLATIMAPTQGKAYVSVSNGILVRPSRVWSTYEDAECATWASGSLECPIGTQPAPAIEPSSQNADWAVAWRLDLLSHLLRSMAHAGLFCRRDGLERVPGSIAHPLLADDFDIAWPASVPPGSEVAATIEPMNVPDIAVDDDGLTTLTFPDVRLRLYVIRWGMPHLVETTTTEVTLEDAELRISNTLLYLGEGSWRATGSDFWGPLISAVLGGSPGIPLGMKVGDWPFASLQVALSRTDEHLVAWFRFDDESPPTFGTGTQLGELSASATSSVVQAAPGGCSTTPTTASEPVLWILLWVLALTGLRLRVIVPAPEDLRT